MSFKKIAWITDPHFDKCDIEEINKLIKEIKQEKCDGVIITGDISERGTTGVYLKFLQSGINIPVWFVLGNHDWYYITREQGNQLLKTYISNKLVWLDQAEGEIKLTKHTCLIGHENWWDAAFGESFGFLDGFVMSEDYKNISFIAAPKGSDAPFMPVRELSRKCTEIILAKLSEAFKEYEEVVLAIHVPPFAEACVVGGIQIPNNWLNHFCNKELGDELKTLMKSLPDKKLKVLAGHTHGKIKIKIQDNLVVKVGKASVGRPKIAAILKF
jgi:predicted MPP superfamily phosphohydrolase